LMQGRSFVRIFFFKILHTPGIFLRVHHAYRNILANSHVNRSFFRGGMIPCQWALFDPFFGKLPKKNSFNLSLNQNHYKGVEGNGLLVNRF